MLHNKLMGFATLSLALMLGGCAATTDMKQDERHYAQDAEAGKYPPASIRKKMETLEESELVLHFDSSSPLKDAWVCWYTVFDKRYVDGIGKFTFRLSGEVDSGQGLDVPAGGFTMCQFNQYSWLNARDCQIVLKNHTEHHVSY